MCNFYFLAACNFVFWPAFLLVDLRIFVGCSGVFLVVGGMYCFGLAVCFVVDCLF